MNQEARTHKTKIKRHKLIHFLRDNYIFALIITLAVALRTYHLLQNYALWWDSSIYLAVAKYIYSSGTSGLWEPYRPLVHPILLGFFWKLGANIAAIGKILDLIFSITTITLSFQITKKLYSKAAGLYTAFILAIEPLFIMYTGLILTEPLALTIALLTIYLFITQNSLHSPLKSLEQKYRHLSIGVLAALAALTKFPLGVIFFAMLLARQLDDSFKYKNIQKRMQSLKQSIYYCLGFTIPFIPYLIFNYIKYKDPLLPFTTGSWIVTTFLWQYDTNFWFYFTHFFGVHQIFLLLMIAIPIYFIKKDFKDEGRTTIFLSATLLFCYFWLQVPRKEVRYLVLVLPFFAILIGPILATIQQKITEFYKKITTYSDGKPVTWQKVIPFFSAITVLIIILVSQTNPNISIAYTYSEYQTPLEELGEYIEENQFEGMILASSPYIAEHIDNSLFPTAGVDLAEAVYDHEYGRFDYVLLVDCDLVCQEGDAECEEAKDQFFKRVDQEQVLIYYDNYSFKHQTCNLFFYLIEDKFKENYENQSLN